MLWGDSKAGMGSAEKLRITRTNMGGEQKTGHKSSIWSETDVAQSAFMEQMCANDRVPAITFQNNCETTLPALPLYRWDSEGFNIHKHALSLPNRKGQRKGSDPSLLCSKTFLYFHQTAARGGNRSREVNQVRESESDHTEAVIDALTNKPKVQWFIAAHGQNNPPRMSLRRCD